MHIEQIQVYRGEIIALVAYGATQRIMELRERGGKLVWEPLPTPPAFDKVREIEKAREVKLVHETVVRQTLDRDTTPSAYEAFMQARDAQYEG